MLQLTTYQTEEEGGDNEKKNDGSAGSGKNRNVQGKRKGEITLSGSMTRQVRSFLSVLSLFLSFFFSTIIPRNWGSRLGSVDLQY